MATLIPITKSSNNVEASYEDIFPEIAKKFFNGSPANGMQLNAFGAAVAAHFAASAGMINPENFWLSNPANLLAQNIFANRQQDLPNPWLPNPSADSVSDDVSESSESSPQNATHNAKTESSSPVEKRYKCTYCSYSTDRRDLYTRHEHIHKDDKPFQCYACFKQFNRADHVKKHFMRMHRDLEYDLNKTRRSIPKSTPPIENTKTVQSANANAPQKDEAPHQILQKILMSSQNKNQMQEAPLNLGVSRPTASAIPPPPLRVKQEFFMPEDKNALSAKKDKDKIFTCDYCPWSGSDKWSLKRHVNTHTKPYVCKLCDYKAARSERLSTHVQRVHSKKVCTKCSYFADSEDEYLEHLNSLQHLNGIDSTSHNSKSISVSATKDSSCPTLNLPKEAALLQRQINNNTISIEFRPKNDLKKCQTPSLPDEEDPRSADRKAMSEFLSKNFQLQEKVRPPKNETSITLVDDCSNDQSQNKENSAENYSHFGMQFQDYVKEVINKYYTETPSHQSPKRKKNLTETEEYIEYLKGRDDITITIVPKTKASPKRSLHNVLKPIDTSNVVEIVSTPDIPFAADFHCDSTTSFEKRHRKQSQPKKIRSSPPEVIMAMLRDKYLNKLMDRKKSCSICTNKKTKKSMLVFPYYSPGSLTLHRLWKHSSRPAACQLCNMKFSKSYSLRLHLKIKHNKLM